MADPQAIGATVESGGAVQLASQAATTVEVNGDVLVDLWDARGEICIKAPQTAVAALQAQGWNPYRADLKTLARDLKPVFDGARTAITTFLKGVEDDGVVDAADEGALAAAEVAVNTLVAQWTILRDSALRQYQTSPRSTPVTVTDPHGRSWDVDPSQERLYRKGDGFRAMNLNPTNQTAPPPEEQLRQQADQAAETLARAERSRQGEDLSSDATATQQKESGS